MGHVLEHLGQSGKHPTVAARPEVFLAAVGLVAGIDVSAVAVVESGLLVEHDAVGIEDVLVEFVKVDLVAREAVEFGHHRHHHVERVGPPPIVVGPGAGLVAHHLQSTGYAVAIGLTVAAAPGDVVEVDVGLETNLPVAEKHIVLSLAIVLVSPLGRICLRGPLPAVVLRPSQGVLQKLAVAREAVGLHVARVIGGIVPEGAHLRLVVGLPIVVHLIYNGCDRFHLPVLGLQDHRKQEQEQKQRALGNAFWQERGGPGKQAGRWFCVCGHVFCCG